MHSLEHESGVGSDRAQTLAVTRRSVVRAGAAAAWTAPLVQVLAPAPAQAVGSVNNLTLTGTFSHSSGSRNFTFSGTVTNSGSITTSNLQITLEWTTSGSSTWAQNGGASAGSNTAGWTASGPTYSNSDNTATIVYTRSSQLAAGANTAFTATLTSANGGNTKNQGGSGSAAATATNFQPGSTGNSYSG